MFLCAASFAFILVTPNWETSNKFCASSSLIRDSSSTNKLSTPSAAPRRASKIFNSPTNFTHTFVACCKALLLLLTKKRTMIDLKNFLVRTNASHLTMLDAAARMTILVTNFLSKNRSLLVIAMNDFQAITLFAMQLFIIRWIVFIARFCFSSVSFRFNNIFSCSFLDKNWKCFSFSSSSRCSSTTSFHCANTP